MTPPQISQARQPFTRGWLALALIGMVWAGVAVRADAAPPAQSGDDGEALFKAKCLACHTIGAGKLVGPDLDGVVARRDRQWLINWLLAPDQTLAAGDPIAVQLLQEYSNVPMPNLALTEAQAVALIAYLEAAQGTVVTKPVPALPAGDPARGRALFIGDARFRNGGPPCMGCHSLAGIGALGGGALGPDLTPAFNKFGEAGLATFLGTSPTATMSAVWGSRPLTSEEQAHLGAFLKAASVSGRPSEALGPLAALAIGGMLGLLLLGQLVWRRRLAVVRRPLVVRSRIS